MNFMGMNFGGKFSGFDKDGNPIPGEKQNADVNFMGMNFKMNSEGFDKDGNPIPGQKQNANFQMGMPNINEFGNFMGNLDKMHQQMENQDNKGGNFGFGGFGF